MPVELFTDGIEPDDPAAVIWRFMDMSKLEDLISTQELHFSRADLFNDETEGLPPNECLPYLGFDSILQQQELDNAIGSIAQFREGFYICCWSLFTEETARMWKDFAMYGVAIESRYSLLKLALESCSNRPHLGLVRYGSKHLTGWNIMRFISTKREQYKHEQEVRAMMWAPDMYAGINRHLDENNRAHSRPLTPPPSRVPRFQRLKVNLSSLVTRIVVSPYAPEATLSSVEEMICDSQLAIPVSISDLKRFQHLLP